MAEFTRWLVIVFGFAWAAWFALMAMAVEKAKNGDRVRVPILFALAWMGAVVALARIVVPSVPATVHNTANRLFVLSAMIPLGLTVSHQMRKYLPWMKQVVKEWFGRG